VVSERKEAGIVPIERISKSILVLRGRRVLLDTDLAELYEVTTKRFNQQVRRNQERFPADFMFQLTDAEAASLRLQIVTLKTGRGQHRKYLPYAFTEHGAIMVATILNSSRAAELSVYVVRAFVELREVLASNKDLAAKFELLERRLDSHDQLIVGILEQTHELMNPTQTRAIGFTADLGCKP
jgi:predicted DNA binding protein